MQRIYTQSRRCPRQGFTGTLLRSRGRTRDGHHAQSAVTLIDVLHGQMANVSVTEEVLS